MCITNIRQRNLSTNKGYRATFTKAQVGKDLGTEAGQYGSLYRFPYSHNALTAKNALVGSVHAPGGGTERTGEEERVWVRFPFPSGALKAMSVPQAALMEVTHQQRAWSQRRTVLTRSPVRD